MLTLRGSRFSKWKAVFTIFVFIWLTVQSMLGYGQSKVNITSKIPSSIDLCGTEQILEFDVRNITTGNVTSIVAEAALPNGMYYVQGTVSGNGVSERSTSNLQKPTFDISDLSITQNAKFTIAVIADCSMASFLSNGGIPTVTLNVTYTGGSGSHKTLPITINQPSINVLSITNQYFSGGLGDKFVRKITIKNSGKGAIQSFSISQTFQSGLKVINVVGGKTSQSGSTITSSFDTSHFKNIGDKNILFDQNEEIVIFDTLQINACSNLAASIKLEWGCNQKVCETKSYSTQVSLVNKSPKLVFTPSSNLSPCFDGNTPSTQQLRIINTGDDTARNILVTLFQSASTGFYGNELSAIDTSSIRMTYGKSGSPSKVIFGKSKLNQVSGILSCLGNNPIGSIETELGYILPGDTVYLNWNSVTCCVSSCFSGVYAHRWKFTATYDDQCQKTLAQPETWGSYGYYHALALNAFTPTDVNDGDTVKFLFTVTSASLYANTSKSLIDVYFDLPKGVKHSLTKNDFRFETHTGTTWLPNSIKMVGDSIHAQFVGTPKVSMVNADLIVKLIGDCSSTSGNSVEDYALYVNYTADPNCSNPCVFRNYCYTDKVRIHCDKTCNTGLKFGDFDVQRISYGLPDNNNDGIADATGSLDMDAIRLERVMYGDTVQAVFKGKINRQGSVTTWTRLTASSTIPYGKYLDVADARIRILRNGNQLYSCDQLNWSSTTTGNNRTFNFDLGVSSLISSSCPLYSGFTYTLADSVELYVKYIVATNPGNFFQEIAMTNSFYLHSVANPNASQKYQCDTFAGKFMLAGSYFTNYGRGVYSNASCDEITVSQNYYLSVGPCCSNYAGGNLFPKEYRRWAKPSNLFIIPPAGYEIVHTYLYDYRTSGTGARTYRFIDTVAQTGQSGDTMIYSISNLFKDKGGNLDISDDGFYGVWYCKLRPTCSAADGSSRVYYGFEFEELDYLGNGTQTVFSPGQSDEIIYSKPIIKLNALSYDVNADSDTAEWQVVVDNSSGNSTSNNIWMSPRDNGNTTVVSIYDVALKKYVTQKNDIFQLGDLGPNKSKTFIIKAIFASCDRDSFVLAVGSDCEGYPDSLADASCITVEQTLIYTPKNTFLTPTISLADSVFDLCSYTTFEVNVKNLSNARAFDLYVDLFLPAGFILKDSAYVHLPGSSDSILLLNPIDIGSGNFRWEVSKYSSYLTSEGLAGVTSNLVNEYTLKCQMITNCDFVSSSYFLARPGGNLRCGKAVLSSYAASKTIDIKGIVKPYFGSLTFDKKPIDVCNYNGIGTFKFLNLGPDTTGVNDYIQLILPKGIYLDTTYLNGISNAPIAKPKVQEGVKYTGIWKIPSGVAIGDSVVFNYKTYVFPSQLDCGPTQIFAQSVVSQPALCVKDSSICTINVSTSSDILLDSIKKGIFQINLNSASSVAKNGGEEVQLSYEISNSGSQKEAGVLMQVKIVADTNGNGFPDAGEFIVARDSIDQQFATGETIKRQTTFNVLSKYACNLLMVVDSTNCVCSSTYTSIGSIHIVNAGNDTLACSRTDLIVGSAKMEGVTYKWLTNNYIQDPDSSRTIFNAVNPSDKNEEFRLLLETDRGKCKSVDTVYITLYPSLFVELQDSVDICEGGRVIVGEVPTGGVSFKTYLWTPADSLQSPTSIKTWANPTTTTNYVLQITDLKNCSIKDSTKVIVHPNPIAKIVYQDTCARIMYDISADIKTGDAYIDSFAYTFGNGTVVINQNPAFTPQTDSSESLSLYVIDTFGCVGTDTQSLMPYSVPVAGFDIKTACQYDSIRTINTSSINQGTMMYQWDIDGTNYTSTDVNHQSINAGEIEIDLLVNSDKGCTDVIKDTITVHYKPELKVAVSNNCLENLTDFYPSVTIAETAQMQPYEWTLGDGTTFTSIQDTSYLYDSAKTYTVICAVESEFGCRDDVEFDVVIHPNPVADFNIQDACLRDSVILTDTSKISTGSIVKYFWNVDGSYVESNTRFAHLFGTYGTKNISLIVESDSGCRDTMQNKLATVNYREYPAFTVYGNCAESPIDFELSLSQPDSISNILWDLDGQLINEKTGKINSWVQNTPNQYDIPVTIMFTNTCEIDTVYKYVIDPKPQAQFDWNLPCEDNLLDVVSNSTTSTGTIQTTSWDLGDGTNSNLTALQHQYASVGDYEVVLVVTNNFNCKDTAEATIPIVNIVQPDFSIQDVCVLDTVRVTETSLARVLDIKSITWKMGDGRTRSGDESFAYAYSDPGSYTVDLSFTTNPGCTYSVSKPIEVFPLPIAGFEMNPDRADVVNSLVTFTSTAVDAVSYQYDFTNGYSEVSPDFIYDFPDTAVYGIKQTVTSINGCLDTITKYITIDFVVNILIPNSFSPNDDGLNSTFSPQGLGISTYDLKVFNRWGEQIYHSDKGVPWNGEGVMTGAYFYVITVFDYQRKPHHFSGIIHVIR